MIRRLVRRVTFDHIAIAFVIVITAGLYYLAAGALLRAATPPAATVAHKLSRVDAASPAEVPPGGLYASAERTDAAAVTTARVSHVFSRIGYDLDSVRADGEVPRVFMASLPTDLPDLPVPKQRKIMFIETALPLILHVNELIARDRARIADLRDQMAAGASLSAADKAWLDHEATVYGLDHVDMDALMRRVDVIPPSLALAQSAEESGWGTSRFAQEGNALFGQRTWNGDNGLVPKQRAEGGRYRVASFDHLMDAVKSYALNLNTHPAYDDFRRARAAQRRTDDDLDGFALAGTLAAYSENGAAYVQTLRTIIRGNSLGVFDHAKLGDRMVTVTMGSPDA